MKKPKIAPNQTGQKKTRVSASIPGTEIVLSMAAAPNTTKRAATRILTVRTLLMKSLEQAS